MWRNDIRNIDIVDATEEGCSNDHQYKHESIEKQSDIIIGFVKMMSNAETQGVKNKCPYLIMSSIIFPMEICSVPRDSWAGRMYASRVKLNMLVTANSTSAISCGSS